MPLDKVAENLNKDPLETADLNQMLNEAGYEPPKEDPPKPIEINETPQSLVDKAATPEDKSFLEKLFQNASPEFAVSPGGVTPVSGGTAEKAKPEILRGAAQGAVGIAENLSQLAYDVANKVDDYAKYFGITEEEMLKPYNIDWKSKLESPDDNIGTKLVAGLVEYTLPGAVAAKAFSLGKVGAAGINVAMDTLAMDPNQERLANLITNSAPELRDYGAIGSVLKYLEHKDGEGNWEGRFKNGLESLIVNSLMFTPEAVSGVVKTSKALSAKSTDGIKKVVDAFTTQIKARTAINTIESAMNSTGKVSAQTAEAVSGAATATAQAAEPTASIFKTSVLQKDNPAYGTLFARGDLDVGDVVARTTHPETIAAGEKILNNEKKLATLLKQDPEKKALTPAEVYAVSKVRQNAAKEIGDLARNVDNLNKEQVLELWDAFTAGKGLGVTEEAVGRTAGQALEARKIQPAEQTVSQATEAAVSKGRQSLIDEVKSALNPSEREILASESMRLMGGEDKMRKIIKDLGNLTMDDIERSKWLAKVSKEGTLPKVGRALNYAMLNNMLGWVSVKGAAFANTVATTVNMVDSFVAQGIRSFRNSDIYRGTMGLPKLTETEKAYEALRYTAITRGYYDGMRRAVGGLGRTLKLDRLNIPLPSGENAYATTKIELGPRAVKGISAVEKMGITKDSSFGMQVFGELMHNVGLRGVSFKALGANDEFYGGINYYSKLSELTTDHLISKKVPLDQFEEAYTKMMKDPLETIHSKAMGHAELSVAAKRAPEDSFVNKIKENPLLNTIFPFTNVTYNSVKYSLDHSPLKLLSLFGDNTTELNRILKGGTQFEKDEAIAKIVVGSTALATLGGLSAMGLVNGATSPNWRVQQATAESGKGYIPYSIGGVSFEKADFVRPFIDLAHLTAQAKSYMDANQFHDFLVYTTSGLLNHFTSNQLLENIADFSDIVDAVSSGELDSARKLQEWGAQFTGRFFPRVGKEVAQEVEKLQNGVVYKRTLKEYGENLKGAESFIAQVKNQLKSDLPWYNQDLPVSRNILGEPQLVPGTGDENSQYRTNTKEKSQLMQKLEILAKDSRVNPGINLDEAPELRLRMPGKNVRFGETTDVGIGTRIPLRTLEGLTPDRGLAFEMTPKQYDKFMQYYGNIHEGAQGPSLRKVLEKTLDDSSPLWKRIESPQTEKQYKEALRNVSKIFSQAEQRAKMMILKDPEFSAAYSKRLMDYYGTQKQFIRGGVQSQPQMLGQ